MHSVGRNRYRKVAHGIDFTLIRNGIKVLRPMTIGLQLPHSNCPRVPPRQFCGENKLQSENAWKFIPCTADFERGLFLYAPDGIALVLGDGGPSAVVFEISGNQPSVGQ